MLWVSLASAVSSWGVDLWFNRQLGLGGWLRSIVEDIDFPYLTVAKTPSGSSTPSPSKKDDDLVVVEADFNGESIEQDLARERRLQVVRSWFSGAALSMAIVGLWGDGA
jgi:autophagy-related protein 33